MPPKSVFQCLPKRIVAADDSVVVYTARITNNYSNLVTKLFITKQNWLCCESLLVKQMGGYQTGCTGPGKALVWVREACRQLHQVPPRVLGSNPRFFLKVSVTYSFHAPFIFHARNVKCTELLYLTTSMIGTMRARVSDGIR